MGSLRQSWRRGDARRAYLLEHQVDFRHVCAADTYERLTAAAQAEGFSVFGVQEIHSGSIENVNSNVECWHGCAHDYLSALQGACYRGVTGPFLHGVG